MSGEIVFDNFTSIWQSLITCILLTKDHLFWVNLDHQRTYFAGLSSLRLRMQACLKHMRFGCCPSWQPVGGVKFMTECVHYDSNLTLRAVKPFMGTWWCYALKLRPLSGILQLNSVHMRVRISDVPLRFRTTDMVWNLEWTSRIPFVVGTAAGTPLRG